MFIFQTENDFVTGRVVVDGPTVGIVYWLLNWLFGHWTFSDICVDDHWTSFMLRSLGLVVFENLKAIYI